MFSSAGESSKRGFRFGFVAPLWGPRRRGRMLNIGSSASPFGRHLGLWVVSCVANVQDLTTQLLSQHWPIKTSDDLFMSCQPKPSLKPAGKDLIFIIIQASHTLLPPDTTQPLHIHTEGVHWSEQTRAQKSSVPGDSSGPLPENAPSSSRGQACLQLPVWGAPCVHVPVWLEASVDCVSSSYYRLPPRNKVLYAPGPRVIGLNKYLFFFFFLIYKVELMPVEIVLICPMTSPLLKNKNKKKGQSHCLWGWRIVKAAWIHLTVSTCSRPTLSSTWPLVSKGKHPPV